MPIAVRRRVNLRPTHRSMSPSPASATVDTAADRVLQSAGPSLRRLTARRAPDRFSSTDTNVRWEEAVVMRYTAHVSRSASIGGAVLALLLISTARTTANDELGQVQFHVSCTAEAQQKFHR